MDLAVHHLDHAVHIVAHAQVMGDHDAGALLLVDQVGEGLHHLVGALGVQAGGRLVGQHHAGSWIRARAMATRCCWPPDNCSG